MNQQQSDAISEYLNNAPEKISDAMFEELVAGMSIYFGTIVFGETIDNMYDKLKSEGKSYEEIVNEIKKAPISNDQVYANLMEKLYKDDDAEMFAEDCVDSIAFNPTYPEEILKVLSDNEVDVEDFSANLIFTFKDAFIDFFVNDINIDEGKEDIIEALVLSGEN